MLQEVLCYAKPEVITNELVFSEVYHALIHSPALETLLNLEHTYSITVGNVIDQRDKDLNLLEQRYLEKTPCCCTQEIEKNMTASNGGVS